jgi:alpha-D-xyloside xylohydrolase
MRGGHVVARQAPADVVGPGGRMSYRVGGSCCSSDGSSLFHLTDLVSQQRVAGGTRYTVATDERGRTARVVVRRTAQGARVSWSFEPADAVTILFEALESGPEEHFLAGSSATAVDLRGRIRAWRPGKEGRHADNYCQNQAEVSAPLYLSSAGYGFYAETSNVGRFAFPGATEVADGPECRLTPSVPAGAPVPIRCPVASTPHADRVQVCVKADELTYDVFAGSPAEVTTGYYRTVGMPKLPPPEQFALMKWRDVNADQFQVVDDVHQFKRLGIPIGTIWVDNPWEEQPPGNTSRINGSACTNTGRFDPRFFPEPQAMIDAVHAQGVKFGLWVTPHVVTTATGGGSCSALNGDWAANGLLVPGTNYIDFTNPVARRRYIQRLTPIFGMGVDMAKEDRAEEFQLETAALAGGPGVTWYNRFPVLYQTAVSEVLRRFNGENFLTLVRTAFTGTAQGTHGIWASDAWQTFSGLRAQLRFGISESLAGHFAWGSDIGGIDAQPPATAANSPTPTLFTRWAQFGAISPVMEVGGAGLNATPWLYPQATVDRFRDAAVLHHELFPYLYGLAERASRTGVPILRAVGYEYPADGQAWALDQQLMVGPALLAAPVTADRAEADGAAGESTPVDVYLPAGRWFDLFGGQVVEGGRRIVRSATLDEFPLYMKAGSAIGFNLRDPNVWTNGWDVDGLAQRGRAGWMVAPGRERTEAISSEHGKLVADGRRGGVALALKRAPAQTQILVLSSEPPRAVRVDGRVLPRYASASALRRADRGWLYTRAPFGGTLVKLQMRAPRNHVDIDLRR